MALSDTVKSSLKDAQDDLREALACAARTEKPFVSKHIAALLADIENLLDATDMIESIESRKFGDSGFFGCLLYTSPSPRDRTRYRMPSSA